MTAEKATVRLSLTSASWPPASDFNAGPMGIMVATRPSMGVTRVTMRGVSRRLNARVSRASALICGSPRQLASRSKPRGSPLRRWRACQRKQPSA
ncbi:hypothetical protein D3C80_1606740 [compost metagenome]